MINKQKNIAEQLLDKQIKPSSHRIKVMEYLLANRNHPTVEQIYTKLKKQCPTLSKATISNSLSLFVEAGLVRVLTMEGKEARYDLDLENHGHFKCESCGDIFDFAINIDDCVADLDNCIVHEKHVLFKGICSECDLITGKN